jgi:hypothetical protein
MYRHAARKQLLVSPHVSLTDGRVLGVLLPPLCGIGPISRATGKQGYDDDAQTVIVFRILHLYGKSITHVDTVS